MQALRVAGATGRTTLPVIPLFETLDDLIVAAGSMARLFSLPAYVNSLQGPQAHFINHTSLPTHWHIITSRQGSPDSFPKSPH